MTRYEPNTLNTFSQHSLSHAMFYIPLGFEENPYKLGVTIFTCIDGFTTLCICICIYIYILFRCVNMPTPPGLHWLQCTLNNHPLSVKSTAYLMFEKHSDQTNQHAHTITNKPNDRGTQPPHEFEPIRNTKYHFLQTL